MKANYVMIDFENVTPDNLDALKQTDFKVMLFVGEGQKSIPKQIAMAMQRIGAKGEYVEIGGTGHNALDFHIAYYIGCISAEDKDAYFHIVSKDKGFDPLVKHLHGRGIFIDRVESIEAIPALMQAKSSKMSLRDQVAQTKERLSKPGVTLPRSRKTLSNHVNAMFGKLLPEERVAAIVDALFAEGFVFENGKRVEFKCERKA